MNQDFWTNRKNGLSNNSGKEAVNLESTAHGGPTTGQNKPNTFGRNDRRTESLGRGGPKRKPRANNPFEAGEVGEGNTVYKTLYGATDEDDQGEAQQANAANTGNSNPIGSRDSAATIDRQNRSTSLSMSRNDEFNEIAEANISRAASQLTEKLSQKLATHDMQFLRERLINPEKITALFPEYFNEPEPPFNPRNLKICLTISMLVALIQDHESGALRYLTWNKRRADGPFDALVRLIAPQRVQDEKLMKLLDAIDEFPSDTMAALGAGLHLFNQVIRKQPESSVCARFGSVLSRFKLTTFPTLNCLKNNKLVVLQGRITLMTTPKLLVLAAPYLCADCGIEFVMHFRDGLFKQPFKCNNLQCGGKSFTMNKTKAKISVIQRFVVQEIGGDRDQRFMGLANCEVRDMMLGNMKLNKVAIISGIWKIEPAAKANAKTVTTKGIYDHYLDVKNIEYMEDSNTLLSSDNPGVLLNYPGRELTFKDSMQDRLTMALANCPLTFYALVGSFCPNVPGQELTKSCLLLTLVGGTNPADLFAQEKNNEDFLRGSFRSNMHALLLGERGVGKTELLKYVEGLSPNSKILLPRSFV